MKTFLIILFVINIYLGILPITKIFSSHEKKNKKVEKFTTIIAVICIVISCFTIIASSLFNYYWLGHYSNQIVYIFTCFSLFINYYYTNFNIKNRDSILLMSYSVSMGIIFLISISLSINGFTNFKEKVLFETENFRLEKPDYEIHNEENNYPNLFVKKGIFERKYVSKSLFDDFRVGSFHIYETYSQSTVRFLKIQKATIFPFEGGYCVFFRLENGKELEADYLLEE